MNVSTGISVSDGAALAEVNDGILVNAFVLIVSPAVGPSIFCWSVWLLLIILELFSEFNLLDIGSYKADANSIDVCCWIGATGAVAVTALIWIDVFLFTENTKSWIKFKFFFIF